MPRMMSKKDFFKALVNARTLRHSSGHPFSSAWARGELTRSQLGFWAIQHFYYIDLIPQQFGYFFCRLPDLDARAHMLENLIGEEMPGKPAKRHPELLLKFAKACGVTRQRAVEADQNGDILPSTRAMRSWIYELIAFRELAESAAGIMVALEGQTPTLYPAYVAACRKLGMSRDDLEFFHVHIVNDVAHEGHGLEITSRYATSPELQRKAIAAVRASASQRLAMLDGIWNALQSGRWNARKAA
ncbi:MAG: iron-containing redox enzyme family protein [Burkholderiales bacterium]|nr:iron-containing redox enzyme family protein [Burkholderiales bacterium]